MSKEFTKDELKDIVKEALKEKEIEDTNRNAYIAFDTGKFIKETLDSINNTDSKEQKEDSYKQDEGSDFNVELNKDKDLVVITFKSDKKAYECDLNNIVDDINTDIQKQIKQYKNEIDTEEIEDDLLNNINKLSKEQIKDIQNAQCIIKGFIETKYFLNEIVKQFIKASEHKEFILNVKPEFVFSIKYNK